ncbi:MAG: YbgA family protein [Streptosporangiaceae bacterium]
MPVPVRPQVGVSSCLLGEEVRFNGGHKRFRFLTDELAPFVEWVPYCPEVEIGLGTPREPIQLTADGRLVNRSETADHTASMASLPVPSGLDGYVFKAKSPSCGVWGIPRYRSDGSAADHAGRGLYSGRVLARFPLLAVEEEGRLNDAGLREAFVERVFAAARLRSLVGGWWEPRDLVAFHARHKLQLLAHDPGRYRAAGRVVAVAGSRSPAAAEYRDLFLAALARSATRGRNANALQHAYSRIGRVLSQPRRRDLVARIDAYRRGQAPLSVPVALLAHYATDGDLPWLAEQTYLEPFPAGLRKGCVGNQ